MKTSLNTIQILKLVSGPALLLLVLNGCRTCGGGMSDPGGCSSLPPPTCTCKGFWTNEAGVCRWVETKGWACPGESDYAHYYCREGNPCTPGHVAKKSGGEAVWVPSAMSGLFGWEKNLYLGRVFGSGLSSGRILSGDFNEDGHTDLVVNGSQTTFLFGAGDGRFSTILVSNINSAVGAAVVDLNRDTHLDLVLLGSSEGGSSWEGEIITVLLGRGDGSFGPPATTTLDEAVGNLAVGDVNGDHFPDVVVWPLADNLEVFLGDAEGTLTPATLVPMPEPELYELRLADLTGDGCAEMIWWNSENGVVRYVSGLDTGELGPVAEVAVGADPWLNAVLAVGDLNRDGRQDLVVGHYDALTILTNQGGGLVLDRTIDFWESGGISALEATDVNGDGQNDIAVQFLETGTSKFTVFALVANDSGGYTKRTMCEHLAAGAGGVLDVTGDGLADGVFKAGEGVTVLKGQADGQLESPSRIDINIALRGRMSSQHLAVGDLDSDGATDLVSQGGGVFFNQGSGSFLPSTLFYDSGLVLPRLATDVAVADVDGDHDLDVLVPLAWDRSVTISNLVRVFHQGPARVFTNFVDYPVGPQPTWLQVGNLGGAHRADVVTLNLPTSATPSISVLRGESSGRFGPAITLPLPDLPARLKPQRLALGDVNRDGQPEILVLSVAERSPYGAYVTVIERDATGGFSAHPPIQLGPGSIYYGAVTAAGDFNNDGQIDVAVIQNASPLQVTLFFADGHGGFSHGLSRPATSYPTFLTVADVDGDGIPDLVAHNGMTGSVTIYAGSGNGAAGLRVAEDYFLGVYERFIAFADLNGDGWPEWITLEDKPDWLFEGDTIQIRPHRNAGNYMAFDLMTKRLRTSSGGYPFYDLVQTYLDEIRDKSDAIFQEYQRAAQEGRTRFEPAIEAWVRFTRGEPADPSITREGVDDLNALLDKVAPLASPELANALASERAAVNHFEGFVGLPLQQAFKVFGLQEKLSIVDVHRLGDQLRIKVDRTPGGQLVLEQTSWLGTTNWQPVAGALQEVKDGRVVLVDPAMPARSTFYRVKEPLP